MITNQYLETGKHYTRKYNNDGYILALFCNHCNYGITHLEVFPNKTGHRWPQMSHDIKRHLRDKHNINLYKK